MRIRFCIKCETWIRHNVSNWKQRTKKLLADLGNGVIHKVYHTIVNCIPMEECNKFQCFSAWATVTNTAICYFITESRT